MATRGGAEEEASEQEAPSRVRAVAAIAILVALVVTAVVLLKGDDEYTVTAQFQSAAALVTGNQVVIGARPVGIVMEIRLAPDGQANVTFTVDEEFTPLHRGTVAT